MTKINQIDKSVKQMESEFKEWEFFLNNGIGILAFSFALGSLGTNSPSVNAFISFLFLSLIYLFGRNKFSKVYKDLRNKKDKTIVEKVMHEGAKKIFLSGKALLLRYPIFLMGYLFLAFVIFSNSLVQQCPIFKAYIYG